MRDLVQFALLGAGAGALYALLGQGLVLIYRGSGVLNFAQGAFAALGAFLFYDLTEAAGLPVPVGMVIAVAVLALLGVAVHLLIMRHLQGRSPLVRLIATLGIFIALVQALVLRWGQDPIIAPSTLPRDSFEALPGVNVGLDRILILGICVALSLGLWALVRRTRWGIAITAVAETPTVAASLGWSPNRIAAATWGAGAALAAVAGILLAPITGLQAGALSLLVIPALAAALVGSFTSFGLALAGGIIIGVGESLVSRYVTAPGWTSAVPFLIIVGLLVVRGRGLPGRDTLVERLPKVGTGEINRIVVLLVSVVAIAVVFVLPVDWVDGVITTLLLALMCISVVIVTGYAGQLSLAQFALAGIGALVAGRAVVGGVPFELALALAFVATVPIGVLVGLPAVRTRGSALAIATLALGLIIQDLVLGNGDLTGGLAGLRVGEFELLGIGLGTVDHPERYAALLVVVVALTAVGASNLRRSGVGRRLLAVRGNERAAAALGINVTSAKLYAFALSAGIAGLAGAFLAFRNDVVTYDEFTVLQSITAVALAVIGGIGFAFGSLIGGVFAAGGLAGVAFTLLGSDVSRYLTLLTGISVIAVVLQAPDGLSALMASRRRRRAVPGRPRALDATPDLAGLDRVVAAALRIDGLTVDFGPVRAVDGVSLTVPPATIVGLIGPNGAGKTTLVDAVSGFVPARAESILLGERRLDGLSAHRRAEAGLTRTFQSVELFDDLTVRENLLVACEPLRTRRWVTALARPGDVQLPAVAEAVVDRLHLTDHLEARPDELPLGVRRLVAIGRSLCTRPSVLLLDEPAAGLSGGESRELADTLRGVADAWGVGVLLIEHDVEFVMSCCDRIAVLDFGCKLADGPPSDVRKNAAVRRAYLGHDDAAVPAGEPVAPEAVR